MGFKPIAIFLYRHAILFRSLFFIIKILYPYSSTVMSLTKAFAFI